MSLIYDHRLDDIKDMSIADGLKELLIDYGFTSERLIRLSRSDVASILEIDEYVAKIILRRNRCPEESLESASTLLTSEIRRKINS